MIGTRDGHDVLYEVFHENQDDPEWATFMFRADETNLPWLPPGELESARRTMGEAAFAQEYLCSSDASSDDVLIPLSLLSRATERHYHGAELVGLPKVVGVDVARFGADKSVVFRQWGPVAFEPLVFDDADNMHLAGLVARLIHEWKPDAVFIDVGRGEGVIDRLRQVGHSVSEVNFGGRPNNPRYGPSAPRCGI